MAKLPCACFDRVLPRELLRQSLSPRTGQAGRVRAIAPMSKMWMNGSTLRVRFIGGSAEQWRVARQQARWWSDSANLRFDFDADGDAEIRVAFDANAGNWSYIGIDARSVPADEPTMNLASVEAGIPAHEFGHAIGLEHECRGVEWNEAEVIGVLAGSPNHWTPEQTQRHFLQRYGKQCINGRAPDPDSIMSLFFPGRWARSGNLEPPRSALSEGDRMLVGSARMYPKVGAD